MHSGKCYLYMFVRNSRVKEILITVLVKLKSLLFRGYFRTVVLWAYSIQFIINLQSIQLPGVLRRVKLGTAKGLN
jgi:hypothetical protein